VYAAIYLRPKAMSFSIAELFRDLLVDVVLSWKIWGIAANVDTLHVLIYANVIYSHLSRECEVPKIDVAEVLRHP